MRQLEEPFGTVGVDDAFTVELRHGMERSEQISDLFRDRCEETERRSRKVIIITSRFFCKACW